MTLVFWCVTRVLSTRIVYDLGYMKIVLHVALETLHDIQHLCNSKTESTTPFYFYGGLF